MKEIVAHFKIVTPMFIGSANQSPSDGIRPPSVKGALRFWWRALSWGRFWRESQNNEENALKALHKEEARLFGTSMGDKNNIGGQGCFLLSVSQPDKINTTDSWPPNNPNHTASYMAYGLLKTKDEDHRYAIEEHIKGDGGIDSVEFKIQILFKKGADEIDIQQITDALETWSLFGGLGGRSRRAMGSITLASIDSGNKLMTKDDYEINIGEILESYRSVPQAPFTAFSKDSLSHLINTGPNARKLVEKMGNEYKEFRGQNGLRGAKKVPFGLPLQDVDMDSRRASPLFFHVHELVNNKFAATNLYMPARIFHPDSKYVKTSTSIVKQFISRGK